MIELLRHALPCPDCLRCIIPALLAWVGMVWALRRANR